jgi:hypothetical protein
MAQLLAITFLLGGLGAAYLLRHWHNSKDA